MKKHLTIAGMSLNQPEKDPNLVKIAEDMDKKNTLKDQYRSIINKYVFIFCVQMGFEKPGIQFVGKGVIRINDYWIELDNVRYAVDNKIQFEVFDEWMDCCSDPKYKSSLENYIKTTRL